MTEYFGIKSIEENILLWSHKIDIFKEEASLAIVLKVTGELIGFIGLGRCRCDDIEIGEPFRTMNMPMKQLEQQSNGGFD